MKPGKVRVPRGLAVAVVAGAVFATAIMPLGAGAGEKPKRPTTGFERSNGAEWTTHEDELKFLAAVDDSSERVSVEVIGRTQEKRPLHLVNVGSPRPHSRADSLRQPTVIFVCTQHGNEPAGREACLQLLRDLAFTDDPALVKQLSETTLLFVPTANPDGRAADRRQNSRGIDINRDHINLVSPEARAIARVVRDWRPELVMDLHEYGPSLPAIYDEEVLYLWPRNLNVDHKVHDLAYELGNEYIDKDAEEAGYSSDHYGLYDVGPVDFHMAAGDGDEGILRNAMGLRHALGILVETAVTADPRNGPQEVVTEAEVNLRRVAAHMTVSLSALRFMREQGAKAADVTAGAFARKTAEGRNRSAPVYFGGDDYNEPSEGEVVDPPPCGYELTSKELREVGDVMALLDIAAVGLAGGNAMVPMGQQAEPVIPLLLDARGQRHAVEAKPLNRC